MDVLILVVLYDVDVLSSETIKSLMIHLDNKYSVINKKILVFNNGPSKVSVDYNCFEAFDEKNFILENNINNVPLSILYNDVISRYKCDRYAILDHDSVVSEDYIAQLDDESYDICVPRIKSLSDDIIYYPFSDNKIITVDSTLNAKNCYSIGSGLLISKRVTEKLFTTYNNVFDECYALYGVDVTFFKRINKIRDQDIKIICRGELLHSLSRVDAVENKFRQMERALDYGITARRYPSLRRSFGLMREVFTKFFGFRFHQLKYTLVGFLLGAHPRVIKWKRSDEKK